MKRISAAVLIFIIGAWSLVSGADVFLNGVRVEGLKNQEFKNCTVTFDQEGIVRISVPGIKVVEVEKDKQAETSKFYVTATMNVPQKTPVTILINQQQAGVIKAGATSTLFDISPFLIKGKNSVTLSAGVTELASTIHFILGHGEQIKGNLQISPLLDTVITYQPQGLSKTIDFTVE